MVGELVEECRRCDISPVAYHSIVFDQAAARMHPEWRLVNRRGEQVVWNREGNPLFAANAQTDSQAGAQAWRFNEACINTGYRQYTLGLIDEIASGYPIDTLFVDIFGVTTSCFCPACREHYAARGVDPQSDRREDVFDRLELWWELWERFLLDIRATLDARRPGIELFINGTLPGRILRHATFAYSEGGEHPHNMDILRGCGLGRLQGGIGYPMFDPLSVAEMRLRTSTILAHGGRLLYFCGPGRRHDGKIEKRWFDYLAPVNAETRRIEPLLEGAEPLAAAAVYHHDANASDIGSPHHLTWMNLWRGIAGVLGAFRRIHLPGDFLPNWRCTPAELARYRLVVVPDAACLADADAAMLAEYVETGGNLLVTGETGWRDERCRARTMPALDRLLGIRTTGRETAYEANTISGYFRPGSHALFRALRPQFEYPMPGTFIRIETVDAEALAWIAEPLAAETPDSFMGWQPLPPREDHRWPGLTVVRRGRGTAMYSVAPLGRYAFDRLRWPSLLIEDVARHLRVGVGITVSGPASMVEATFHRRGPRILVHLVNRTPSIGTNELELLEGLALEVDAGAHPRVTRASIAYPDAARLAAERTGDTIRFRLPIAGAHTIVSLEE
jgi:hypothetical protein